MNMCGQVMNEFESHIRENLGSKQACVWCFTHPLTQKRSALCVRVSVGKLTNLTPQKSPLCKTNKIRLVKAAKQLFPAA